MKKLDEIFQIVETPPRMLEVPEANPVIIEGVGNEEDVDFHTARSNTLEIIDQCRAATHTAMKVAAETENPRALEVLGNMLKISSDINKTLILLSKDRADTKTAKGTKSTQTVQQIGTQQNVTFVGNASDMNKLLAEKMAQPK